MKWNRGPVIGRGSSATVSLATNSISGDLFAVKHTELSRSLPLQNEQSLLSKLTPSPYIVKYLGSDVTSEGDNLVCNLHIEYISGGTLHDTIRNTVRGFLDELDIKFYTRGILRGLEHLHASGVAHCDVKSQNVLVAGDGAVKIADLGCAKLVGEGESSPFSGTPMFMSPEVVRGEEQGVAADLWALGCTVVEMATGRAPWPEEKDSVSVVYRVGFSGDVPEIPRWLSEEAKDFLEKCLRRDPRERWSVGELLSHPFIGESEACRESKAVGFSSWSPNGVLDRVFWESGDESSSSSHMDVDWSDPSSLKSAQSCSFNTSHAKNDENVHACSAYQSLVHYDDRFLKSSGCASGRIKNLMMLGEFKSGDESSISSHMDVDWSDHVLVSSSKSTNDENVHARSAYQSLVRYGDEFMKSSGFANERIKKLMMIGEFDARLTVWGNNGDWVAVRSNEEEEYDENVSVSVVMSEMMSPVSPAARVMDLVSEEISFYENSVISLFSEELKLYHDDSSNVQYYTFNEYIFGLIIEFLAKFYN